MPKVVIKEYDQTEAGLITTNNFTVVIPGFVNPQVWSPEGDDSGNGNKKEDGTEIFDANRLYECVSQKDFVKYVGKVNPLEGRGVNRIFAKVTTPAEITRSEFFDTYKNKLYTREQLDEEPAEDKGRLISKEIITDPETGEITETNYYQYTLVNSQAQIDDGANFDPSTAYYIIEPGDEGADEVAETFIPQYGNQMAYYLLGLGYTVLYLRLDYIEDIKDTEIWEPLKDRSMYDFRYLVSGLMSDVKNPEITVNEINALLETIAHNYNSNVVSDAESYLKEGRGDCIALQDIAKNIYMEDTSNLDIFKPKTQAAFVQAVKENLPTTSEYCAIVAPTVFYSGIEDTDYGKNNEFPASFHYLACAAQAFTRYPEWFAVSGYTRGVSNLNVIGTSITLGEAAVNALQSRDSSKAGVNLVIKLRNGYYFWGNRTGKAQTGLIATNFLNIRQLCCTLKKTIYNVCRRLMFDPNSEILWLNFCNAIRPTLERMMGSQGIKGYRFEKRETSMKGKLFAVIRIIPIEAVEDFEIGVFLEDNFDNENIQVTERLIG